MAGVRLFTDLRIWQQSRQWSKDIFWKTQEARFNSERRFVTQINDSSESVMANITDGFGRGTQGEFVQFLGYSIGSLNETQSHLCAAYDREYIVEAVFGGLFRQGTDIRKGIVAFIKSMVKHGSGVKHLRKEVKWSNQVWELYKRITGEQRPELWRDDGHT